MDKYHVKLTFTEPILGTVPKDREVYAAYIATRAALDDETLAEELASVETVEEKGWTGFHTDKDGPFLYDYVIKGFFKDACGMLRRVKGTESKKLTAYRKVIDGLVFPTPRKIRLVLPGTEGSGTVVIGAYEERKNPNYDPHCEDPHDPDFNEKILVRIGIKTRKTKPKVGICERPLRAQTAQGERIALARSDTCPPGTVIEFDLVILGGVSEALLREWLDYGALRGLGQWRNSGKGRFSHELTAR